jgi:chaperonin GroES
MAEFTHEPLGNRVVVKPSEESADMSAGGIYIPDTAKEKPQEGEIVAVGPGRINDSGDRIAVDLSVGDTVVYPQFVGTEFKQDNIEYLIIGEDDILVVR